VDTPGNIIDKLMTVNLKIHYNLRSANYGKLINLNSQRISLENEIDILINQIANGAIRKDDISRPQHKTY